MVIASALLKLIKVNSCNYFTMFLKNKKIATKHAIVLIIGTLIGFIGRYLQFNDIRFTALIPGSIGLLIIALAKAKCARENILHIAFFLVILLFGIILTRMSLKFAFQEFQPLRKRINFPVMALSSIVSIILMTKNYLESKKKDSRCLLPHDQQPG